MTNIDFFLIGAQKCATSWMYLCLKEHPEISVPNQKEDGYIGGKLFDDNGKDWFFERFISKPEVKSVGDVSVEYMYNLHTAPLLKEYASNPKFIVSLRHPVDRLISSYYWLIRVGTLPNIPIEEALEDVLSQPVGFPNKIEGPLEEIVRRSCYPHQIKNYFNHFDKNQFLFVKYEDIKGNEEFIMDKVFSFLNVSTFTPPSIKKQQLKNTYNKTSLYLENKINRKTLLGRAFAKMAILANMSIVKSSKIEEVLSKEKRNKLNELFRPQIEETEALIQSISQENYITLNTKESINIW